MVYLAVVLLLINCLQLGQLLYAWWKVGWLPPEPPTPEGPWPKVSIIIPARDEETGIREALQSVLHLDYPDYEIIVINDRSTDRTAAILEEMQAEHPNLRLLTIETLPPGWLGKNHALHQGAGLATGEWLLFTDADVVFSPNCLKNALAVAQGEQLDHLTLSPTAHSPSLLVNLLVNLFARNFSTFVKPWQASNPRSRRFVGLGVFNLVRRSVYQQVGGYETIRLRPDDDMKLGKIIKQAGFRQDIRFAPEQLAVMWYPTVPAMTRGLEKNILAGFDYRATLLFLALFLLAFLEVAPWVLAVIGTPLVQTLALAAGLAAMTGFALFFPQTRTPWLCVFLEPLVGLLMVYIFARSAFLTLTRRGIYWRDTFYKLKELKANQV